MGMNADSRTVYNPRISNEPLALYEGTVISTTDQTLNGRIKVFIPALQSLPIPTENSEQFLLDNASTCFWSSPFAGTANKGREGGDPGDPANARTSYGMWMVPPDVGNRVLVAFAGGKLKYGYVVACLFDYDANHMVPGTPVASDTGAGPGLLAVSEKPLGDRTNKSNRPVYPGPLTANAVASGIVHAGSRGIGNSGARREAPSEVFGILTPGPLDHNDNERKRRLGGHQLVMDDNLDSQLIRLRTANNMQILLDDTEGMIFINNQDGSCWVEINNAGKVMVYSKSDISMRAGGDFQIRADHDIIMEAGNDIKIKAAANSLNGNPVTPFPGFGGHVQIEANGNFTLFSGMNLNASTLLGDISLFSGKSLGLCGTSQAVLASKLGSVVLEGKTNMTLSAPLGISMGSLGPVSLSGPGILLNSEGGLPITEAPGMTIVRPLPTTPFYSRSPGSPVYTPPPPAPAAEATPASPDATAATDAGGGGARPTESPQSSPPVPIRPEAPASRTIANNVPGPQPDAGSRPSRPQDSGDQVQPDDSTTGALPSGCSDAQGDPDDVSSPGGVFQGLGMADETGSPIDNRVQRTVLTIADKAAEIATTAKSTVGDIVDIAKTFTTGGDQNSDTASGTAGAETTDLTAVADKFSGVSQKIQTVAQDICNLPGQIAGAVTGLVRAELQKIADKVTAEISEKIGAGVAKINQIIGMAGGNHLVIPANVGAIITIIQTIIELSQLEFPCSLKDMKNSLTQGLVQGITGAVTGVVGDSLNQITGELNDAVTSVLGTAKNALVGRLVDAIPGDNILTDLVESGIAMVGDNVAYAVDRGINRRIIDSGNKLVDLTFRSIPTYAEITGVGNNFRYPTDKRLFDQPKDLIPLEALTAAISPLTQPGKNRAGEDIIGSGYVLSEEELKYRFVAVDPTGASIPVSDPQVEDMRLQISDSLANSATQDELEAMLGYYGITVRTDIIYQGNGEKSYIFQNKEGLILVDFTRGLGHTGATIMMSAKLVQVWEAIKSHIRVKLNDNQSMAMASFALDIGPEAFLQSDVLDALNRGEYNQISRLMQGWVAVKRPYNNFKTIVPQLKARRHFEGQLFQTPDEVVIGSNPNKLPGQTTFDQLAYKIKYIRRELLIDKAARNGYEIKPFPCCDCD